MAGTTVTGAWAGPFADAVLTVLQQDATLLTLLGRGDATVGATRITAGQKQQLQLGYPRVVGGRRDATDAGGALQLEGGQAAFWLDVWSDRNGPHEVHQIQARVRVLLQRDTRRLVAAALVGFALVEGSLTCAEEHVFPDFDPDMPKQGLYHGVQRWLADIDEVS